jgi:hypothetical protein
VKVEVKVKVKLSLCLLFGTTFKQHQNLALLVMTGLFILAFLVSFFVSPTLSLVTLVSRTQQ